MRKHTVHNLYEKYPPSEACGCRICLAYCARPGWWTVDEAARALEANLGGRMMLEVSPEHTVAVLSPAFRGCEKYFAVNEHAHNGCTFLEKGLCRLHGTGMQPLECRFCHHARVGLGAKCHADLEKNWGTSAGQALVVRWMKENGLWHLRRFVSLPWMK